jgi:excisionase family DNA binding protein
VVIARLRILRGAVQIDAESEDSVSAGLVSEAMVNESAEGVILSFRDGWSVALSLSLVEVVRASASELVRTRQWTANHRVLAETILTPAEAAQILGLSRQFVARLLNKGEIDSKGLPGSRPPRRPPSHW